MTKVYFAPTRPGETAEAASQHYPEGGFRAGDSPDIPRALPDPVVEILHRLSFRRYHTPMVRNLIQASTGGCNKLM